MARPRKKDLADMPAVYVIKAKYEPRRTYYGGRREKGSTKLLMHFSRMGSTILDHLTERRFDLTDLFRQKMVEIFKACNRQDLIEALANGEIKLKWDRYAGCRCGCSPAMVVKPVGDYKVNPGNIWVDWSLTPMVLKSREVAAKPKYATASEKVEIKKVAAGFDQHVLPGLQFVKPESWQFRDGNPGTYKIVA